MKHRTDEKVVAGPLPEVDYTAIGKRIRQLRKQLGLTQAGLAIRIGISTSFCGHIERGTRVSSLETILRIAKTLGVTVDALLTGFSTASEGHGNSTRKMRMLNDIMRVLDAHAAEWLRNG